MDIIGSWKIAAMMRLNAASEFCWKTAEELMEEDDPELAQQLSVLTVFTEDGAVLTVMPIPENVSKEEIDAVIASGQAELWGDGMIVLQKHEWKQEDGKLLYNTGAHGEVLGEEISPWIELSFDGEELVLPFIRLARA